MKHFNCKFLSNAKTKNIFAQSEYFFTLDWSNFILHDVVRIFCRENTVVFLRRGIGISSGWSSSLFTRPLCGSKNPKRSKAAPREREDRRARCERRWNLYSASSWPFPGQFFFNLNLEQPPRPPSLSAFLPPPKLPPRSSRRPVSLALPPAIQNAGQTTINTFSQAGWQTRWGVELPCEHVRA